ncbi:MAG: hypothetical protein B7C54_06010 [Acidimicrobiales bacterium mtb01]|nr:MAG: hypothetical protein B7C54_06010 [Acidimicrobiales bacterium mtb01]
MVGDGSGEIGESTTGRVDHPVGDAVGWSADTEDGRLITAQVDQPSGEATISIDDSGAEECGQSGGHHRGTAAPFGRRNDDEHDDLSRAGRRGSR